MNRNPFPDFLNARLPVEPDAPGPALQSLPEVGPEDDWDPLHPVDTMRDLEMKRFQETLDRMEQYEREHAPEAPVIPDF